MATRHFTAMVARSAKDAAGGPTSELREFERVSELPQQDPDATVEVEVAYSDLNYKDGLIVLGRSGVVKSFPIVPGIDFAGTVVRARRVDARDVYTPIRSMTYRLELRHTLLDKCTPLRVGCGPNAGSYNLLPEESIGW